jgi:hypothetical protein
MDAFTEKVVMTGGVVAHNSYLVEMVPDNYMEPPILVPDLPSLRAQLTASPICKRDIWELRN